MSTRSRPGTPVSSSRLPTEEGLLTSLRRASRVVVFTGSGVSAESGVPTFRDAQTGLWSNFDATKLATPDAFRRDPALVWGWYEWRRAVVQKAQPNAAHRAIATMATRVPAFTLVTQNVDCTSAPEAETCCIFMGSSRDRTARGAGRRGHLLRNLRWRQLGCESTPLHA